MMKNSTLLSVAREDFEQLKRKNQIPPKMRAKLDYLLASLLDQKPLLLMLAEQLPDYEKATLEALNKQTQTELFLNIVNCLSGRESIPYFKDQKAYIRKEQTFSMWNQCYLSLDSNTLSVKKKVESEPSTEFEVINLRISKKYKEYKRKIVLGIVYKKKHNYLIGFNQESACARIHEIIRNLIREKFQQRNSLIKSRLNEKQEKKKSEVTSEVDEEGMQSQEIANLFQNISIDQIFNKDYKLLRNCENGRFLLNMRYPNKTKVILMLKNSKPMNIIESFMMMNEWNPQIEECTVKTKFCENNYLMMIKLKKYSYFSWARYAIVVVTALIIQDKYYLIVRNVEEQGGNDSKDMVKMNLNQLLQVTTSTQNPDINLLTLITDADYCGYCSVEDSKNMSLKFLNHLQGFQKFVQTQQVSKITHKYFNFDKAKQIKKGKQKSSTNVAKKEEEVVQFQFPDRVSQSIPSEVTGQRMQEVKCMPQNKQLSIDLTQYMMKNDENYVINEELVSLLQKYKLHEKYYLKHSFDQTPHIDKTRYEHEVIGENNYLWQNGTWKMIQNEDIIFTDAEVLKVQKNIFKYILKQLGSNLVSGKSVMNMSLPVQIFQKRSILERIAMGFGYSAKFLVPGGQTDNAIQQAKFVTKFFSGMAPLHLNISKPFNPILGETFEARIGGIPVYMEQISHHPPISAVYMKTDTFRFYGTFNSHVELGLNCVVGMNLNPLFVEFFNTKLTFMAKVAQMEITGTMFGDRKYRAAGKMFIYEKKNHLWSEISYGKEKKKVYPFKNGKMKLTNIVGGIYKVTEKFGQSFLNCEVKRKFQGISEDDVVQTHVQIQGHWATDLRFNGEQVRSVQSPIPNKLEYPKYVLPSDSNFRPDIIYKRIDNLKVSNEEKEVLENIQRRDRKLRSGEIKSK